jgi:hypothetical protein
MATLGMRLMYLPANVAWVFVFGDAPTRIAGEPLFFKTRAEAVAAAARKCLAVDKAGKVTTA